MKPKTPDYVRTLAKGMRTKPTQAESNLWYYLRRKGLLGFKFYRQYPIGRYIADFCCPEKNIIVEIDGGIHKEKRQREYDNIRNRTLYCEGMTVIRFNNDAVLYDIEYVIKSIESALLNSNHPLPHNGGGAGERAAEEPDEAADTISSTR